eukprot:1614276-Amphidinium_carterae.1
MKPSDLQQHLAQDSQSHFLFACACREIVAGSSFQNPPLLNPKTESGTEGATFPSFTGFDARLVNSAESQHV